MDNLSGTLRVLDSECAEGNTPRKVSHLCSHKISNRERNNVKISYPNSNMKLYLYILSLFAVVAADDISNSTKPDSTIPNPAEDAPSASLLRGSKSGGGSKKYDYIKLKRYDKKCLSVDSYKPYYARVESCSSSNYYQDWYYDDGYIKNRQFSGKCLTVLTKHHKKYLAMKSCNGYDAQKWWYDHNDYRFHSYYGKNYCMDYCRDCGHYVHIRKCRNKWDKDQKYLVGRYFW